MMASIEIPAIDWNLLAPLALLLGGAIVVTLLALGPRILRRMTGVTALVVLLPAALATVRLWSRAGTATVGLSGMIKMDHFAICFCLLFLATAALTILLSMPLRSEPWDDAAGAHGEYFALILFATSGMMLMAASTHLLVLFLGLEILSLPLYILVGFTRRRDRGLEASMKYFLLGAFSTGFTIYGMAMMYGATGTLDLAAMWSLVAEGRRGGSFLLLGFGLAVVGFLFKMAAFPFHYWAPDVYQGAPTPITAFMIAGTKAAAFAAVLRIITAPLFWEGPFTADWTKLLAVLAALTMTAGNVVALVQKDIKRMLAYSGIAHAGYILVAVVAHTQDGVASVIFYLAAYLFMNLGAFAVVVAIERVRGGSQQGHPIASYAGLCRCHPVLAATLTLFLLSLTGVPLTGGFFGKFYIFKSAVDAQLYGLAIVGLLNSAVAAAYYLNVVITIYMKDSPSESPAVATPVPLGLGIAISVAGVLYLGIFPSRILEIMRHLLL